MGNQLTYYRVVLALFGLAYFLSQYLGPLSVSQTDSFILPRLVIALIAVIIIGLSFTFTQIRVYISEIAASYFTLTTIHLIGFFSVNNFETHFELALIPVILFTNLHLFRVNHLVIYNVIVFAMMEYIFVSSKLFSENLEPILFFVFLIIVMMIGIVYQIHRIKSNNNLNQRRSIIEDLMEKIPDPWVLFKGPGLVAIDSNQKAKDLFYSSENNDQLTIQQILSETTSDDIDQLNKSNITRKIMNCSTAHGKVQPFMISSNKLDLKGDYLLISFQNISDNIQSIHENDIGIALQYRNYIESISEALIITSSEGEIRMLNKAANNLITSGNGTQLVGVPLYKIIDEDLILKLIKLALDNISGTEIREQQDTSSNILQAGTIVRVRKIESVLEEGHELVWSILTPQFNSGIDLLDEAIVSPLINTWNTGILITNTEYSILKFNNTVERISSYNNQELRSLKLSSIIHPSDIDILDRASNGIKGDEIRILTKEGIIKWCTIRKIKSDSEYTVILEDINQWKNIELSLNELSNNMDAVIENTNAPIVSLDFNLDIVVMNTSFKDYCISKYEKSPKAGENIWNCISHDQKTLWKVEIEKSLKGISSNIIVPEIENNEQIFHEISFYPVINIKGYTTGVTIMMKDVTVQENHERQILLQKEDAIKATKAKSGFLATMSHEIRTPLNGLIGMIELLNTTELSEDQRHYANSIHLSGETLLNLINDILDFSKIESDKLVLNKQEFNLKTCIEDTFEILHYRAAEKNDTLQFHIESSVPEIILGDKVRIRQVLMNLVGNAIKFTKDGTISIIVSINHADSKLQFEVKDTGVGIAPEKKEQIFNEFSQADSTISTDYGGTGLGLTISSRLIKLMDGEIWVESTPGIGSSFYFTIGNIHKQVIEKVFQKSLPFNFKDKSILLITENSILKSKLNKITKEWNSSFDVLPGNEHKNIIDLLDSYDIVLIEINDSTIFKSIVNLNKSPGNKNVVIGIKNWNEAINISIEEGVGIFDIIANGLPNSSKLGRLINTQLEQKNKIDDPEIPVKNKTTQQLLSTQFPVKILIADDNAVNQSLLGLQFEKLGYHPDVVSNGLEVLAQLDNQWYDIVFMDIQMPELNGLETTKQIVKKFGKNQYPIIIAMTGYAGDEDKKKSTDAGMNDYLVKPIKMDDIIAAIKKWSSYTKKDIELLIDREAIKRIKSMSGDDLEFTNKLLEMYFEQSSINIKEINNFLKLEDFDMLRQSAHKLKGSSLNIGAKAVAMICQEIENCSGNETSSNLLSIVHSLDPLFVETKRYLDELYR